MELYIDLGLKEIASIINRMGLTTDTNLSGEVELNGKKYFYEKVGNKFTVTDSDNKQTIININYSSVNEKDSYNRDVTYDKHEVSIDYLLENGEIINLSNIIPLDSGYESFENVHRHDLISGLRTKYCDVDGKEIASFNLGLNEICLKDNNIKYIFDEEGIKYNNVVLSLDGNTLVSISGEEIPSKELISSFKLKDEQDKIERIIIDNKDLHPFTKEELENTLRKLDRRERFVKKVEGFYNEDIKNIRKVIDIRNRIINGIENSILPKDGLEEVENDFYKNTMNNVKRKRYL